MAYASFGQYLRTKQNKLVIQGSAQQPKSQLFANLVFYFNGLQSTKLTLMELKRLVIQHGAAVKDHFNGSVTHMICSQITSSKLESVKVPILRVDWLLDSIQKNILLKLGEYLIVKDSHGDYYRSSAREREYEDLNLNDPKIRSRVSIDQDFIKNYFDASRLHHLSNAKTELLKYVDAQMSEIHQIQIKVVKTSSVIMHVDMDCFFVAVALRNRPDLTEAPVVVGHDGSTTDSTSEISSCNYHARKFGIKNGDSVGSAQKKCPQLVILPYDFKGIKECSQALFDILIHNSDFCEAVSCDEAYIDTSSLGDPIAHARKLRGLVKDATGCVCSIGIGFSVLVARLATYSAKPDGIYRIDHDNCSDVISNTTIDRLPGLGRANQSKFEPLNIKTCGDLKLLSLPEIQKLVGDKLGDRLFLNCRGICSRSLENKGRSSVGAEINWAIRFQTQAQIIDFIKLFCIEVHERLIKSGLSVSGLSVCAKERKYRGEPAKYLGCGQCQNYSKFIPVKDVTIENLFIKIVDVYESFKIGAIDLRGFGVHFKTNVKALDVGQRKINFDSISENYINRSLFGKVSKRTLDMRDDVLEDLGIDAQDSVLHYEENEIVNKKRKIDFSNFLPSFSQIDPNVLACLPKSIQLEQKQEAKKKQKINLKFRKEKVVVVEEKRIVPNIKNIIDPIIITDWIREWAKCLEPLDQDIDVVCQYLGDLIRDMNLEKCVEILKILGQRLNGFQNRKDESNDIVFDRILASTNSIVLEVYGSKLHPKSYH